MPWASRSAPWWTRSRTQAGDQVHWDARDQRGAEVAAWVYLTRLHHPGGAQTRRVLYLK